MTKYTALLFVLFLLSSIHSFSQRRPIKDLKFEQAQPFRDSTNTSGSVNVKLSGKTKYTDYKIFSFQRDTTYIDTTLSIQKEYKFNFLRKDHFELLGFHNQGTDLYQFGL